MRARFVTAPKMINDLGNYKPSPAKEKAFTKYVNPHVLIIDEIGYVNYDINAANDLYEIISRRYEKASTIITTNQAIGDWGEFFPGAACAMSLIDRFVHHVHVIDIDGPSWRLKECKERSENKD